MKISLFLAPCVFVSLCLAHGAQAQTLDLGALQKQLAASPLAQQVMASSSTQQVLMQQAMQQAAANPQLLNTMATSLSPSQQATLMQQVLAVGQKMLTPAEQAKLTQFTSTPEGASIVAKLPQMAQQLAPVVLQMYASSMSGAAAPAAGK